MLGFQAYPSSLVVFTLLYVCGALKIGGKVYNQKTAKFGPQPGSYDLTAISAIAVPTEACTPLEEDLTGKIALVKRGGQECYFVDKSWHAQAAGAVGVIVGAVSKNTKLITMFAKENSPHEITIPAIFVEYDTFEALQQAEGQNVTMNNEGEQQNYYDPLHWEFAKSFLVVLPIVFIAGCCCYMVLRYIKQVYLAFRRTENARRLPTIKFKVGEIHNSNCCICIEDFQTNESTKVLPCGHGYHPGCIDEWLSNHSDLCPMCKRSIFSEPTHPLGTPTCCDRVKAMFGCERCCSRFSTNTPESSRRTAGPRLLSNAQARNAVQAV